MGTSRRKVAHPAQALSPQLAFPAHAVDYNVTNPVEKVGLHFTSNKCCNIFIFLSRSEYRPATSTSNKSENCWACLVFFPAHSQL